MFAVVAVVDVVALPERAPEKIKAVSVPVLGTYVNGPVVSSTNNWVDVPATVFINGI